MAKNKSGGSVGGFVFNIFNVGFTVVMFLLPTAGLVYWYVYIRDPGGGVAKQPQVIVQEVPRQRDRVQPIREQPAAPTPQHASGGFFNVPAGTSIESENSSAGDPAASVRSARTEYEPRTWKDPTGKFSIEASFFSVSGDQVTIVKSDGTRIDVPIAKLSDEDKEYLRDIFRGKGIQPRF